MRPRLALSTDFGNAKTLDPADYSGALGAELAVVPMPGFRCEFAPNLDPSDVWNLIGCRAAFPKQWTRRAKITTHGNANNFVVLFEGERANI